jgi:hypothetical protein
MTADADEKHDSHQLYNQSPCHLLETSLIHVVVAPPLIDEKARSATFLPTTQVMRIGAVAEG